ncbi:MAG: glycosyltransferase, partial [Ignavibacteria bacterium]|nr:glycosyltransferase [Ignavibacteria bacterium]
VDIEFININKKDNPLVSVIIPCYNQAEFLPEAVESVVNQTFQDWECIIVNDGSTDNTKTVANEVISRYRDKRIKYLEKINEGVAIARNFGISNSQGKYILPLDADDKIHPTFLEKAVDILQKEPSISIVFSDQVYFGNEERIVETQDWNPSSEIKTNQIGITSLFRREVWETVGGYKSDVGYEDWELWISAIENGFRAYRIPEPLFYHRITEISKYSLDKKKDIYNKAKIISLHPNIYSRSQLIWAKNFVFNNASTIEFQNITGLIPDFSVRQNHPYFSFKILAILSAYNEEDIILTTIKDLIENGIDVYLIDDNSSDNTIEIARQFLGKGLINIERFNSNATDFERNKYNWELILKRKIEIANELNYNWYIHGDADEFFESPWLNLNLKEAFYLVDSLGYNTICFKLYNFRPYNNNYNPDLDVRNVIDHFELPEIYDRIQIKAWKKVAENVDLSQSGGHEVIFQGRNVFPLPFIMRHYPIRSEEHGKKKVLKERFPRFKTQERAKNWHIQYDKLVENQKFIWNKDELIRWDPVKVRMDIFEEFTLQSFLLNSLVGVNYNTINTFSLSMNILSRFSDFEEHNIQDILKPFEENLKYLFRADPEKVSLEIMNKINQEALQIIQNYLTIKFCQYSLVGNYGVASKIREILLYLQNKQLLLPPFSTIASIKSGIELFKEDVKIYPKEVVEELIELRKFEEAEQIIENYLKSSPEDIDALNDLAVIKILYGEFEKSEEILNKILQIDSENIAAKENLKILKELSSQ